MERKQINDLEGMSLKMDTDTSTTEQSYMPPTEWRSETSPAVYRTSISSEEFEKTDVLAALFATARNPVACMFHILFKGAAIVAFMFLNALLDQDIVSFVVIVLFAAIDFWTVQNVTGRLLVNLRWWSEIDDSGHEVWRYESDQSKKADQLAAHAGDPLAQEKMKRAEQENSTDSKVFWTALYVTPLVWMWFMFMQLISLRFFWLITAMICFTLAFTNA